jgi:hypothetical protein
MQLLQIVASDIPAVAVVDIPAVAVDIPAVAVVDIPAAAVDIGNL